MALLTTGLDPERFETLLVAGREGRAEGTMLELGRIPRDLPVLRVDRLGRSVSVLADARALVDVIRIARRYRPDVVHTHLAKAGFIGRLAARVAGAKAVVHTFHGSVFSGYFGSLGASLYLRTERALARLTDRIVAITPLQRAELVALGIAAERKIVQIPLGLDLRQFEQAPARRDARAALGLDENAHIVLYVGRLVAIKDVGTLLRALAATDPRVTGLIVGDGSERSRLEALSLELGLTRRCRFLGWRSDLAVLYAAADVVALSSLNEGSPVSLIEALAAGSCVVATAVGGVPDVIAHDRTGLLVPPRDPEALAAAIERALADHTLREELGTRGRTAVLERFASARLIRDISGLYESLLLESS